MHMYPAVHSSVFMVPLVDLDSHAVLGRTPGGMRTKVLGDDVFSLLTRMSIDPFVSRAQT
jgi:hypothetical protein